MCDIFAKVSQFPRKKKNCLNFITKHHTREKFIWGHMQLKDYLDVTKI